MTESTHEHGHETPSYDDVNTPVIVLVGAIAALVTLLTIMFVQGLCYHWQNSFIRKRSMEVENMPAVVEVNRQKEMLSGQNGLVSIEDAMKKVVTNYAK
ncbi:MAG: hypothetical protein AB8B55_21015 [Mariniblastus sp.]